jgi:hypothetical protein
VVPPYSGTKSILTHWGIAFCFRAVNALNVPHELKVLDLANKEHMGDAYLKVREWAICNYMLSSLSALSCCLVINNLVRR